MLKKFLANISYQPLLIAAIFLGLAPFSPEPHLLEKSKMLLSGNLARPLDIFDLFFHLSPTLVLLLKWLAQHERLRTRS